MAFAGLVDVPPMPETEIARSIKIQPRIHWECWNPECSLLKASGIPMKARIGCDAEGLVELADANAFKEKYENPYNYGGRVIIDHAP